MALFAIMDNILGHREDMAYIKLNKAFSPESENMMLFQGEAKRMKGRLKDFTDATFTSGTVTIANGSANIVGSATTAWKSGVLTPLWGSADLAATTGRQIIITDGEGTAHTHTIKSITDATHLVLDTAISTSAAGADLIGCSYVLGVSGAKIITPDENTIFHYHTHNDDRNAIEYIFAFTKAHIYRWMPIYSAFVLYYTNPGNDVTLWDTAEINDKVVATSNKDFVQVWSDGANGSADTAFADMGVADSGILVATGKYLTRAKYAKVYENTLFLGYTTEGGSVYPWRRRNSTVDDETDFNVDGTGDTGKKDFLGKGVVKGFGLYTANNANLLITFMKDGVTGSIQASWLTTADVVFENNELNNSIGLLATHSVVNDKDGNLYFYATDYTIRKLFDPNPISKAIEDTVKGISLTYEDYIEATFIDRFNLLAWSIPETPSSTGNDRVLYYDVQESLIAGAHIWYRGSWAVRAFGNWTRQTTLTIDTLDTLYSSIDGIGLESIDSVEVRTGFPLDLASDYSGYTFALHASEKDDGSDYTGTLVICTDLSDKGTPTVYKRINQGITHFYNPELSDIFTVNHTYKREDDASWQNGLGSSNLYGTGRTTRSHIPCDIRSRDFLFRQQATNRFSWLGCVLDFEWDGTR